MRTAGLATVNPSHPDLPVLIEQGAEIGMFEQAARQAAQRGKSFAYALGIVRGQLQDAVSAQQASPRQTTGQARHQAKSFAQQEREAGWKRWEQMTGQTHPDRIDYERETGLVIDATTHQPLRIVQ